jgi:tripeptide aminopeptidase
MDYPHLVKEVSEKQQTRKIKLLFEDIKDELKQDWKNIARIYAPSGNEVLRAEYLVRRFGEIGVDETYIDAHGNAVARIDGEGDGPVFVYLGTMDDLATVAEMVKNWDKPILEEDGKMVGPGTNISATCITILGLAMLFRSLETEFKGTVYLVGVVQEETGLIGVQGFLDDHPETTYLVDIMAGLGRMSYGCLGIHWFKVHFKGPKAHTLMGEGPNVTKGIAQAVNQIWQLDRVLEPDEVRVYLNISMMGAGHVFNHRHDDGWFSVDIRSPNNTNLENMRERVLNVLKTVAEEQELGYWIEDFQKGPAGLIPGSRESDLVRVAEEYSKLLGVEPRVSPRGSSNMNVGVRKGVLSISTGGDRGGNRNTLNEFANIEPVFEGLWWDFLIGYTLLR